MGNYSVEGNYEQLILEILARIKRLEDAEVLAAELSDISDDTGFGVYPHQYHGALTSFRWFDSTGIQYIPEVYTLVSLTTLSGHQACNSASQANDGDYVSVKIPLVAGTYMTKLSYTMGPDFGSFYMSVDGIAIPLSFDAYAILDSENNELSMTNITVYHDEIHEIRFTINGTSGSDYRFGGSNFIMVRDESIAPF